MPGNATAAGTLMVCALLTGCSEKVLFARGDGTLPQTAQECRMAYDAARARTRQAGMVPRNSAEALGAGIGRSIARGNIDSAYTTCLARVGAPAPQGGKAGRIAKPPTAPAGGFCARGGGVLQGGSGYCIGH